RLLRQEALLDGHFEALRTLLLHRGVQQALVCFDDQEGSGLPLRRCVKRAGAADDAQAKGTQQTSTPQHTTSVMSQHISHSSVSGGCGPRRGFSRRSWRARRLYAAAPSMRSHALTLGGRVCLTLCMLASAATIMAVEQPLSDYTITSWSRRDGVEAPIWSMCQ